MSCCLFFLKQPLLPLYHLINPCNILPYILDILASVDAVCAIRIRYRPDTLGACSRSSCHDCLLFLHDQYIVYAGRALCRIAHVFHIACHALLSVEIVWFKPHLLTVGCAEIHMLLSVDHLHIAVAVLENGESCSSLYCE